MNDEDDSTFTLMPSGTQVYAPNEFNEVTIQFPRSDDAITFYEFLRSFVSGEISLEAVEGRK